ncbi:hypothetical protein LCGC14_3038720, partial [marine sediment metagenome]
ASETNRKGIGTFLPGDTKNQSITELVGSVDFSKLGEFGVESDPRAYKFDGELNVANRGIMEMIEMLKVDPKFLYVLLTLAQEKTIKTERFPLIYADEFILAHSVTGDSPVPYRKDGKIKFYVQIRLKGHAPQTASFDRLTDARKWIQEVESSIRNNRYFKTAESRKHNFNQLADRYIASVLPEKKTASDQKAQLFWWKKHIGNMLLADITPSIISEYKEKLLTEKTKKGKKRTGSTANRYLSIISHVFTVACKEWGWVRENPLSFVSKLKEPKGRVRFLSDDERERLLTTCKSSKNSYLYTIVVLALSSGMRLGEILNLTWSNVDFKHQRIILEETKNGERRQVPLKGRALDLLKLL